jgi:hypothetical protein
MISIAFITLLGAIIGVSVMYVVLWLVKSRAPARCSSCKYFDLAEGQSAMRQFPSFMQAAGVLSPSKMNTKVTYDDEGERHEERPAVSTTAKWDHFGACLCPSQADNDGSAVLKWGGDICPDFSRGRVDQLPQLVQIRR